jgi:RHS repeat-associated protein
MLLAGATMLAAPAFALTINLSLDPLMASGLGDCTPSGPGQCNGNPPDPPVEIGSGGLPFDRALLAGTTLGPIPRWPCREASPSRSPPGFPLRRRHRRGSGGPDPGTCPDPGAGGVLSSLSFSRSVTVNGTAYAFQQSGSIRVGWCFDVFTLNAVSVPIDTGQGILTLNVGGAAPVVSNGPTTVSLTSPLAGGSFAGTVALSAAAAVTIGAVDKIEFYRGATLVASVTSPPYTASDTGVLPGTYSYTARAYNAQDPNTSFLVSVAASVTVTSAVAQQLYFIQTDHLNTPRLIANQAGTTVWRWDQGEPFGNDVPNNNPSGAGAFDFPLRFPGQYFDRETSLAYNYYRDYDPSIGRYIQSDPIGLRGGINPYAYVGGNPLSRSDPSGNLGPVGVILVVAGVGAAAEGVTTIVNNINNGLPITTNLIPALLGGAIEGAILGATVVGLGGVGAIGFTTPLEVTVSRIGTAIVLGTGANLITAGKVLGTPADQPQCP